MKLKIVVLTPTPSAIESIAAAVKPLLRANIRAPYRRSCHNILTYRLRDFQRCLLKLLNAKGNMKIACHMIRRYESLRF
jgi:hypothetical protein